MPLKDTPPLVSIVSGGIAGGVEGFSTYPFELAKTRAQLGELPSTSTSARTSWIPSSKTPSVLQKPSRNPYLIIARIYRSEGLRALYKGCGIMVIGSVGKDAVRFLSFDTVKNSFRDPETGNLSPVRNMLAGISAGVVASLAAVTPTERIKTAMIDDARGGMGTGRYEGTMGCIRSILKEDGVKGLYRGLVGTTLKQASATGLRMGSYNIIKDAEVKRGVRQGTGVNFANGAVAGVVTTLLSQPFDTIKTRSQSAKVTTTMQAITGVWTESGVRGFWKGTVMRLSRTVFSGGILFTVAEAVSQVITPLVGR